VVRVNDRGPFIGNRLIDLSYTAALKLDMVRAGTAFVEVRAVGPDASAATRLANATGPATTDSAATAHATTESASPSPPASPTTVAMATADPGEARSAPAAAVAAVTALYVQAGAFAEELNATRLVERLRGAGLANVFVGKRSRPPRTLFRVRVGPVSSVEEFDRLVARLAVLGIPDARLALD
jgi:rare lipoprotein A